MFEKEGTQRGQAGTNSLEIITHLSRAYSMLAMPTACSPALAACRAATLTRLARSAPLKPGVPRAMVCRSTSGAKGMFCGRSEKIQHRRTQERGQV
jgi:hypothetical protein